MKGRFLARCTGSKDVKFGMSKNGNMQIAVLFQYSNQNDDCYGQTIVWMGTFAPGKASEIALQAMENCGWRGDDLLDLTGIDSEEVELVIGEKPSDDGLRMFDYVEFVNRPGAGKFTFSQPVEGAVLAQHAGMIRANIRAIRAGQGRTPAGRPASKPTRVNLPQKSKPEEVPPLFDDDAVDPDLGF